jgi:hypothetical protein
MAGVIVTPTIYAKDAAYALGKLSRSLDCQATVKALAHRVPDERTVVLSTGIWRVETTNLRLFSAMVTVRRNSDIA